MTLHFGDCLDVLPTLDAESIDAIVTDPPYGLAFMGKHWDHGLPGEDFWAAMLRVAKPGAHLLAFGGTRTYHRLASAIEDAGWEIRDTLVWAYASGFPKSHNLDGEWQGWGTALKPAWEPIVLARKPLRGTVAANVQAYGTGALNIDGCRIPGVPPSVPQPDFRSVNGRSTHLDANARLGGSRGSSDSRPSRAAHARGDIPLDAPTTPSQWGSACEHPEPSRVFDSGGWSCSRCEQFIDPDDGGSSRVMSEASGRWPANVILTDPIFDGDTPGVVGGEPEWSRFFAITKADRDDREPVLGRSPDARVNGHPTVKSTDLMRHLVRLVTPPGGLVLDPFMGSGTTALACEMEGFRWVGIEREAEYVAIAEARLNGTQRGLGLVG